MSDSGSGREANPPRSSGAPALGGHVFGPHPGLEFDEHGAPFDRQHGDVFRSRHGAWQEAATVFVEGCRLRERWAARERFTILETGFGLGVNFLSTLGAWRSDPARCANLHFVSIESRPLSREDLGRGLAALADRPAAISGAPAPGPDASATAADVEQLLAGWPPALPGLHRLVFADGAVRLTLAFSDAARIAPKLLLRADAFYLDGFAPSRNPDMWSPQLIRALARHAAPGARLATWSTAPQLREALQAAGFETSRLPGVAGKRRRLEAVWAPRWPRAPSPPEPAPLAERRVLVVGAGLAGVAVAEGFARRGFVVELLEAHEAPGCEGSSQPLCADHLHLSPDDNPLARLSRTALLLRRPTANPAARGRLVLDADADAGERAAAMLERLAFPVSFVRRLQRDEASEIAGIALPRGALWLPGCDAIARRESVHSRLARGGTAIRFRSATHVARLEHDPASGNWVALDADGRSLAIAPLVVLANAGDATRLGAMPGMPLQRMRGQTTWLRDASLAGLRTVLGGPAYAAPSAEADGRVLVGASFDDGDSPLPDPRDDKDNLRRLGQMLGVAPEPWATGAASAVAGFRFVFPDHLPAIGALPDEAAVQRQRAELARNDRLPIPLAPGLYGAFGFGSRGLLWAELAAELLPAIVCGEPAPLERDLLDAITPARFLRRRLRRGG